MLYTTYGSPKIVYLRNNMNNYSDLYRLSSSRRLYINAHIPLIIYLYFAFRAVCSKFSYCMLNMTKHISLINLFNLMVQLVFQM